LAATLALAGTVVGDLVWYEIGRRAGHRVLKWMCRLSIEPDTCVRGGEDSFARRGASALLIAKFLPGLNSIGQPLAGALGMPRQRFVIFDVLGAVLWVGLYVGLGYASPISWPRLPSSPTAWAAGPSRSSPAPSGSRARAKAT